MTLFRIDTHDDTTHETQDEFFLNNFLIILTPPEDLGPVLGLITSENDPVEDLTRSTNHDIDLQENNE